MSGKKKANLPRKGLKIGVNPKNRPKERSVLTMNQHDPENPMYELYAGSFEDSPAFTDFVWREHQVIQSVRFQSAINIPEDQTLKKPAFLKTNVANSEVINDLQRSLFEPQKFYQSCIDMGLVDQHFLNYIERTRPLFPELCGVNYITGKESSLSVELKKFNALAILILQGVKNFLNGEIVFGTHMFKCWANIRFQAPETALKLTKKQAQQALNLLDDWWITFTYPEKLLKATIIEIGLITSPLTAFPLKESPQIKETKGLMDHYKDKKVRVISLFSKHRLLGESVDFLFNPHARAVSHEGQYNVHSRMITFDDLNDTLVQAYELLRVRDWKQVKSKFEKASKRMDSFEESIWSQRLKDIDKLEYCVNFLADYIHAIGFMEPIDLSVQEDNEMVIGWFLHLHIEVGAWAFDEKQFQLLDMRIAQDNALTHQKIEIPSIVHDNDFNLRQIDYHPLNIKDAPPPEKYVAGEDYDNREVTESEIRQLAGILESKYNENKEGITQAHVGNFLFNIKGKVEEIEIEREATLEDVLMNLAEKEGQKIPDTTEVELPANNVGDKIRKKIVKYHDKQSTDPKGHDVWQSLVKKFPLASRKKIKVKGVNKTCWGFHSNKQPGTSGRKIAEWMLDNFREEARIKMESYLLESNHTPPSAPTNVTASVVSEIA